MRRKRTNLRRLKARVVTRLGKVTAHRVFEVKMLLIMEMKVMETRKRRCKTFRLLKRKTPWLSNN